MDQYRRIGWGAREDGAGRMNGEKVLLYLLCGVKSFGCITTVAVAEDGLASEARQCSP
jgi:hypothetical protein